MKIVNYNTWHGLNQVNPIKMGSFESKEQKEERVQLQIQELKKLEADIIFLQELNPVNDLSFRYAKELNMDFVYQPDNFGIKIFSFGLPLNLYTGLVILAKKNLNLRKLKSKKLSGPFGFQSLFFSFQLSEFRYALFAEINKKTLLVNTHFHHGVNPEVFKKSLQKKGLKAKLFEEILYQIKKGEARRFSEVLNLLKSFPSHYSSIILAGDLNDRFDSRVIQKILKKDLYLHLML